MTDEFVLFACYSALSTVVFDLGLLIHEGDFTKFITFKSKIISLS